MKESVVVMMARYSDDPVADFEAYDAEQEAALELLPKCSHCGEPIQDDTCFLINDEPICENCMELFRVYTTYLMG